MTKLSSESSKRGTGCLSRNEVQTLFPQGRGLHCPRFPFAVCGICQRQGPRDHLCSVFDGEEESIRCKTLPFGAEGDESAQANRLFYDLRTCDDLGIKNIYVRCPSSEGVGLAVMNRLLRAAEYRFIDL